MRCFASLVIAGLVMIGAGAQAQTKKIVFVAGPKEHGAPGRHEFLRRNGS